MGDQPLYLDDCVDKIIDEYSHTVYKLAFAQTRNRSDADDVFQEVFLRYIRKQPRFESREHERAWFIRVTINCCKNLWGTEFWLHTNQLKLDDKATEIEVDSLLEDYLDKLPTKYRTVIHLFYYENLTTIQISETLKRKETTVRMQLTRARRLLKKFLEGDNYYVR